MSAGEHWAIRVPASSANLGSGFDVLGMALTLHAEIGCGVAPTDSQSADDHHPATVAFRAAGGNGDLWVRSSIPMGRGMGFSGAVRVGGAAAALVQRRGAGALEDANCRQQVFDVAAELEGHGDNAAASLYGGVVAVADRVATRVPLAFDPGVVVWVPNEGSTSTDHSRTVLNERVDRDDAVFNLGRVATLVAAFASGEADLLRMATADRLHQQPRLDDAPESAAALEAALGAGVWAAWLSGSGPSVAMLCESARCDEVAELLPGTGHAKRLHIDHEGATVTETGSPDSIDC